MSESVTTGLRASHVGLIGKYWLRFSMRTGGGIMALLVTLVVGMSVAQAFIAPVESFMQASPELGFSEDEMLFEMERLAESDTVTETVEWVTGADEGEGKYLLSDNPALLSVILLVLLMVYPFMTSLVGFNQTAGDISSKGLRYLLLRTERSNIFFGRFVGATLFTFVSAAALLVVVTLYVGVKFQLYPADELVLWSLQGWVALCLLSLPYLAICAWMSSVIDSAFGSLALSLMLIGFPVILLKLTDMTLRGDQGWLERLTPWGWKYELLSGDMVTRMVAIAVMIGFTACFLFLGARNFAKRDL